MEAEYRLEDSRKGVGPLYPVLEDPHGNIIDGRHRRKVDPNWPSIVVNWVKSREDLLAARIAANVCRRTVPKEERKRELEELATIMLNRGVPKGKIAKEIAEKTGLNPDYIRQMLPKKFKLSTRAKAGAKGRAKQLTVEEESADTELYTRKTENRASFNKRSEKKGERILPSLAGQKSSVSRGNVFSSSFKERLETAIGESSKKASKATDIFRCKCHRSYRVYWKARRIEEFEEDPYAPLDRMLQYYPQEFIDYVNLRVGEITRDDEKAGSYDFMEKAVRKFLEVLWREVSEDRFLMDAVEEDFKVALKEL